MAGSSLVPRRSGECGAGWGAGCGAGWGARLLSRSLASSSENCNTGAGDEPDTLHTVALVTAALTLYSTPHHSHNIEHGGEDYGRATVSTLRGLSFIHIS